MLQHFPQPDAGAADEENRIFRRRAFSVLLFELADGLFEALRLGVDELECFGRDVGGDAIAALDERVTAGIAQEFHFGPGWEFAIGRAALLWAGDVVFGGGSEDVSWRKGARCFLRS